MLDVVNPALRFLLRSIPLFYLNGERGIKLGMSHVATARRCFPCRFSQQFHLNNAAFPIFHDMQQLDVFHPPPMGRMTLRMA